MITISRLTASSSQAAAQLNALLPQLSDEVRPLTVEILQHLVSGDDTLIIAQDGERIVGAVLLVVNHQLVRTKAWLEDLVVDDAYRGQGIGKRLVTAAIEAAQQTTAVSLDISSKPSRSALYGMYEKLGFVRRDTALFRLRLI